jgi:hypothetical protein
MSISSSPPLHCLACQAAGLPFIVSAPHVCPAPHRDNIDAATTDCAHERTRIDDGISSCLDCGDRIDTL